MRVKTLQILWHDKEPIFSVDFEPNGAGRFATAGGDHNVRVWKLAKDDHDLPVVQYLASLTRHAEAVNCVRWAPNGGTLASAGDDGSILLWQQTEQKEGAAFGEQEDGALETWRVAHILRGGTAAIYDIAWSPDASYIISACIDNTSRLFDVKEQRCIEGLADHGHFVQGVAWDPLGKYFVSQSSDRSLNVYTYEYKKSSIHVKLAGRQTKLDLAKCASRGENAKTEKRITPVTDENSAPNSCNNDSKAPSKAFRLFHDETLTSFFRRLTFSPDGALLFAPAGVYRSDAEAGENRNAVHIYGRGRILSQPLTYLPGNSKPSIAVRCSPVTYKLRNIRPDGPVSPPPVTSQSANGSPIPPPVSLFALPYRYMYAVACQDALVIYDTQQLDPLAYISGLHYATLTDLAWSSDGCTLLMTSTDGFCSVVSFDEGELGERANVVVSKTIGEVMNTPPTSPPRAVPMEVDKPSVLGGQPTMQMKRDADKPGPEAPEKKKRRIAPTFLGVAAPGK
ncbi:WD40-repeat-containing domain protein [Powellomyces hirtus]|nr:WD40-repeat-containing domain protein [Powellomyces hirtus]